MKRKILTILVSMLFITMIPSVTGKIADSGADITELNLDDERVWIRGSFLDGRIVGKPKSLFVITLVIIYNISSNPQREVYRFKWADEIDFLRDILPYLGRMCEILLGSIKFIWGFYNI